MIRTPLLALAGVLALLHAPLLAQKDVPRPLQPLRPSASIMRSAVTTKERLPSPFEYANYRGTGTVLLSAPGIEITDGDLFLYAIITSQLNLRDVVEWQEVEGEKPLAAMRTLITQYMQAIMYASRADLSEVDADFAEKGSRILAGNGARMLWADTVIRNAVHIFPEDIMFAIKSDQARFFSPQTVSLRRLRVPFSEDSGADSVAAARERTLALRERALLGSGLAELMEAEPELLVDPPGRLAEVTKDMTEIDPQIMAAAFSLRVGQISEPIRTPGGFVLVEVADRTDPQRASVATLSEKVRNELEARHIALQLEYEAGREIRKARPALRGHLWEFLPEDADIITVRGFRVTKGEMKKLFPELFDRPEFSSQLLQIRLLEILLNEVIMQNLKKEGYEEDEFLEKSREMGRMLFEAGTEIRRRRAAVEYTDEEIEQFKIDHPDRFLPGPTKVVYKFTMAARDPEDLTPGEIDSLRILMRIYMRDQILATEQQLAERRSMVGNRAYEQAQTIVKSLPAPPDKRVKSEIYHQGAYNRWSAKENLPIDYELLELGRFTEPQIERGGFIASYYVSEIRPEEPLAAEQLATIARLEFVTDAAMKDLVDQIDAWEKSGQLRWHPKLAPPPESKKTASARP